MRNSLLGKLILFFVGTILFASCGKENGSDSRVDGLKPIYVKPENIHNILVKKLDGNYSIPNDAQVKLHGTLLFVTDNGEGFYLWDNSNPRTPTAKLRFDVPGVDNLSLAYETGPSGEALVSFKNYDDLVKMELLSNGNDKYAGAKLFRRYIGYYQNFEVPTVPVTTGYWECYDSSKGILVAWKKAVISKPLCFQ